GPIVAGPGGAPVGYVQPGDGTGRFLSQPDYPVGESVPLLPRLAVTDLNGDGRPDVLVHIVETTGDRLAVRLGVGDGTLEPAADIPLARSATVVQAGQFVLGDFTGDGRLDVLTAHQYSDDGFQTTSFDGISVLPGNGNGTYGNRVDTRLGVRIGNDFV